MRLLIVFTGLMIVFLTSWLLWGGSWEDRFTLGGTINYLDTLGPWPWIGGLGLLVADIILPVPGTVVMSALGFLYGPFLGGLLASVGSMLAGLTGYGLCRLLGERPARALLGSKDFDRGRRLFATGGGWLVCVSRALPLFPEAVACTAGLVRMPFRRFLVSLACGSVPMGMIFAAVGAAGRDSPAWALGLSLLLPLILWSAARPLMKRLEPDDQDTS